jgi:UDP-N-acetylmuramoylalanine--D-glutamate ligase
MSSAIPLRLPWRTALVLGLGRSGLAAAALLREGGVSVRGYDRSASVEGLARGVIPILGRTEPPDAAFHGVDLVVLSPGLPPEPIRERIRRRAPDAEVHGELSLALSLIRRGAEPFAQVPTVLVTGTNGKSTVTALTGALLEAAGHRPFAGGNLGTPLAQLLLDHVRGRQAWPDSMVIECSSFQLETLRPHPTSCAMVVSVSPDHLDRYPSMEAYVRTKTRVFEGLGRDDLALLDATDPWTSRIVPRSGCRTAYVEGDPGGIIEGEGPGSALVLSSGERYRRDLLGLAGRHNSKNALFGLLAARHLSASADDCRIGLASFEGLPHRMTFVRELDGVAYYDDSKATNVASVLAGLWGFDRPIVLVAGGRPKGDDLAPLAGLLAARGRALVAFGEAAEALCEVARAEVRTERTSSLDEAVIRARALARPGDAVVLSPACASYDQFRSYVERGEAFCRAVRTLEG